MFAGSQCRNQDGLGGGIPPAKAAYLLSDHLVTLARPGPFVSALDRMVSSCERCDLALPTELALMVEAGRIVVCCSLAYCNVCRRP